MKADLHNHSFLSDGVLSVKEIVNYSKKIGLDCISITDHDTMAGVITAYTLGEKLGIDVIPGVEISSVDYKTNRSVHMLCYFPKDIFKLQGFLNKTLISREKAKRNMAKMLMEEYPVTMGHIENYSHKSESMYETHIMQPLADLGYSNIVIGELYKKLLSKKGKYYVQIQYPSVDDVLKVIKEVDGIAVMAHPGQFNSLELLADLARNKMVQGVEYNHPRNSEEDKEKIKYIAEKYNLIMTGGTDFHGYYTNQPYPIGSFLCPEGQVEKLIELGNKKSWL
ncbi:phosphatase [Clostridium zeae]|uniref:Phosphatase n=1 Tax=Clostridium zeae TaxID=2759022 RepID=A0ABQ1EFL2_9CLOT|nr:PHP domain-containing protein [Clostridium zeae]GFZ33434.1 phosphatase [Clostridium zeae]